MNRTWKIYLERIFIFIVYIFIVLGVYCTCKNAERQADAAQSPRTPIVCAPKAAKAIPLLTPANRSAWKAERRSAENAKGAKKPKTQRERIKR